MNIERWAEVEGRGEEQADGAGGCGADINSKWKEFYTCINENEIRRWVNWVNWWINGNKKFRQ